MVSKVETSFRVSFPVSVQMFKKAVDETTEKKKKKKKKD